MKKAKAPQSDKVLLSSLKALRALLLRETREYLTEERGIKAFVKEVVERHTVGAVRYAMGIERVTWDRYEFTKGAPLEKKVIAAAQEALAAVMPILEKAKKLSPKEMVKLQKGYRYAFLEKLRDEVHTRAQADASNLADKLMKEVAKKPFSVPMPVLLGAISEMEDSEEEEDEEESDAAFDDDPLDF